MTDTLFYSRIFNAPRELVFECMTSAEHLTHFWGPTGVTAPLAGITVDCRPGGRFEVLMMNDDGSSYLMRVVYDKVSSPDLLVWTDLDTGMRTTSTFIDLDDGRTEMRIAQDHPPAFAATAAARAGFLSSFDRFSDYLSSISEFISKEGRT